jgi:predicted nucleic acid-binding protein
VTLCDTGPLVALIDKDDAHHMRCVAALNRLPPEPLLTTWPCLAEAMYLLGRGGGFSAQDELWGYIDNGLVTIHSAQEKEWERMRALMQRYQDTPMDLADASLVAAAEHRGFRRVFTLDSHFHAYRLNGRDPFP